MRRQRQSVDIGLRELARILGCPHSFLSQIETGKEPAPAWLRAVYGQLTPDMDLADLSQLRKRRTADSDKDLLRKRLSVEEELVIVLGSTGVDHSFHRLWLRAVSANVPAISFREIDGAEFDDLNYTVLEGGKAAFGRRISGRVELGVKFPLPLARREEHAVSVVVENLRESGDWCLRWPSTHYGLRRLAVRLWLPPEDTGRFTTRRVDGLEPHVAVTDDDRWPRLACTANGLVTTNFTRLFPGFGYGIAWERSH